MMDNHVTVSEMMMSPPAVLPTTVWGTLSNQPTLTELVRLGIANEEPDYITDPVYSRYQDHMSPWQVKQDTQVQFLEQNDMMIPPSEHSIPQESLAYLAEDDNSYLKLEQDLSSDTPVDVIGDGLYSCGDPVNLNPSTLKLTSTNKSMIGPLFGSPSSLHSAVHSQQHSIPHSSSIQQHLSCSKPNSLNCLAMPEIDITGGQRTVFPHLQTLTDHGFSLQKLLGFGTHEQHQNSLRALAGTRPMISRCITHISPQPSAPFQRFRQEKVQRPCSKGETKRKYVKRMSKDEQIQKGNNLWQFLMRLLGSRTDIVAWTGNDLEFRIVNKDEIARRWGIIKNREKMNFDKFSRALRYYYNKRILIHNPQCRLTYCFMRNPTDPVFCEMLQSAMHTLPNLHVCSALCNNSSHSHEMQYEKRKIRRKSVLVAEPERLGRPFSI